MPPKRRKGKGKRKKKGKKKGKAEVDPPPLHDLTTLYNLLVEKIRHLNEMRILTRKKRLEAWFMTREITNLKSDNAIYMDHLNDTINDLYEIISRISDEIAKERAAIQREIDRLLAELNKKHAHMLQRTAELEEQLERVKLELLEFEPLMQRLAKMIAKLEELARQIEAAELEADIKTRHLKNQFLFQRARLHNHLEKQLFDLIQNCRSYIMPILWHHMRKSQFTNGCTRWQLAKADARNIKLGELRDELTLRRKLLTIEKSYTGVEWAFYKLAEAQSEQKKLRISGQKTVKAQSEEPPTELASAFNIYLKKRLTAYYEAKKRAAKLKKLMALRTPVVTVEGPTPPDGEYPGEGDEDDDEWEDVEELERVVTERFKPKRRVRRRHRPKYYIDEDGEEEEEEDDDGLESEGDEDDEESYSSDEEEDEEHDTEGEGDGSSSSENEPRAPRPSTSAGKARGPSKGSIRHSQLSIPPPLDN